MTAAPAPDECALKWCNEAGEHTEHRQYLTSMATSKSSWVLGVNVVESEAGPEVEVTAVPRRGASIVVPLSPDEATVIGESLVAAALKNMSVPANAAADRRHHGRSDRR